MRCVAVFAALCVGADARQPADSPGVLTRNGTARRAELPPSPTCANSKKPIQLQSPDVVRTAGLRFAQLQEQPLTATITRNAEVVYNANRYARLSPRAAGVIADVRRDLGDAVAPGDVLAVLDSAELGSAKADFFQALAAIQLWKRSAERQRSLADRGIGTEGEALEAENKLAEAQISQAKAKQRLRNLGLSDADMGSLEELQDTSSRLQLTAPFDAIVVERSAVLGEVVDTTTVLFTVANTQTMWAMVDLFEADWANVAAGQAAIFSLESVPGHAFPGKITWISTHLDQATRTLKARAEIANENGLLRANTFGRVQIIVRRGERAIVVPKEAVQWDGCCNIVFVKSNEEGTVFQPTQVRLGVDTGAGYEALSGVQNGDVLVTAGSYLLKTEILKGSIGAGCCDHVENLDK
jgi:cobalt-zinc-cadmium efflux system membrane fusion protein